MRFVFLHEHELGLDLDDLPFSERLRINDTERLAEQALDVLAHHQHRKRQHACERVEVVAAERAACELVGR